MSSFDIVRDLISRGKIESAIGYMRLHKMIPQYFREENLKLEKQGHTPWYSPYYPVTEAASRGQLDLMNSLIENGFDPDNKDISLDLLQRPILHACTSGHLHIVKCLIENHNVNLHSNNWDKNAPLFVAIRENHTDIVKYLIESGAFVNDMLHMCVSCCDPKMVQYLLSKGVDVNVRCSIGNTPLFLTTQSHFPYSNALVLLDAGADVDAKNKHGDTTFIYAAVYHEVDLMRLLISRGADANVVNNDGNTALHWALNGRQDDEVIKYLVVELGLECLNTRNSEGVTPFTKALRYGCNESVFELLVNYGCNFTDEFDIMDDIDKEKLLKQMPNCTGFFQHLKQFASQPRSLEALASLKLRRHLGVRLEAAVKELSLPEILKNLVRIQKMDVDI